MSRKAQTFSVDFMIASSIFVLAFSILYIYWTYASMQISETREVNEMIDKTYLISHVWFRGGTPKYWNSTNVIDLGLSNNHRFNQTKMNILNESIGYDKAKDLLSVGVYEIFFRVYNTTNDTLYTFGSYPSDPENVIKIKRVGILNRSVAIVEVMVWK